MIPLNIVYQVMRLRLTQRLPADRLRARRGGVGRKRREEDAGGAAWTPGGRSRHAGGRPSCDVEVESRPPGVEPPANTSLCQHCALAENEHYFTSSATTVFLCL